MGQREEELQKRVLCLAGWVKKKRQQEKAEEKKKQSGQYNKHIFFCSCNIGSFMTTLFSVSHTSPFG
jgi:hypothetical protein